MTGPVRLPSPVKYNKQAAAASHRRTAVFCIDGESVNAQQIADRLGVGVDTARNRLAREQKSAGPVTWDGLGKQ